MTREQIGFWIGCVLIVLMTVRMAGADDAADAYVCADESECSTTIDVSALTFGNLYQIGSAPLRYADLVYSDHDGAFVTATQQADGSVVVRVLASRASDVRVEYVSTEDELWQQDEGPEWVKEDR